MYYVTTPCQIAVTYCGYVIHPPPPPSPPHPGAGGAGIAWGAAQASVKLRDGGRCLNTGGLPARMDAQIAAHLQAAAHPSAVYQKAEKFAYAHDRRRSIKIDAQCLTGRLRFVYPCSNVNATGRRTPSGEPRWASTERLPRLRPQVPTSAFVLMD